MPVGVNLGAPMAGASASGGGVIPLPANDFPLLINSSPIAPGAASAATGTTTSTSGGPINCGDSGGGGGRVLVTGVGASGCHGRSGGPSTGHASRESSTGPIRYGT